MAKTIRQALRGRSDFISDTYVRGMVYAITIRSPYPSARILRISGDDLPSGAVLVTAADIPGPNCLTVGDETMPILASEIAYYAGEPIALVAAPDQVSVVEAQSRVVVELEELPAVTDPSGGTARAARTMRGNRGDVHHALSTSHQIVQGTFETGVQEHLYNEPQGAVVEPDQGRFRIRTATQWPFHVRRTVAQNLGVPESSCTVRGTDPGISLDGKLWFPSLIATHAALVSQACGKPVKMIYSNIEDYQYSPKRSPYTASYLTGIGDDGELDAVKCSISFSTGAYPLFTREMAARAIAAATGSYKCDAVEVDVTATQCNLPPLNGLSGFGMAPVFFALETHVNRISEINKVDAGQWRIAHLVNGEGSPSTRSQQARGQTVIRRAMEQSDYRRKSAAFELQRQRRSEGVDLRRPTMGIGIAYAYQGSGFINQPDRNYSSTVCVRLLADGTAVLRTSAVTGGNATKSRWRGQVAEILGLSESAVRIEAVDTDLVPDSGPSTLSCNLTVVGKLISQACLAIQKKRFRSPLPIEVRRSYRSGRSAGWQPDTLEGKPFTQTSHAAAIVETQVNPVTYETRVTNVVLVVDAGLVLDEIEARRSLEMSVHQALEWSTHEVVVFSDGAVDPRSYLSYRDGGDSVLPKITIELLPSAVREPCGIGELPQSCVPAALATAVSQATSRFMDRIPTNPSLIHGYIEQTHSRGSGLSETVSEGVQ